MLQRIDGKHKLKWRLRFSLKPVLISRSNINLNLPLIAVSPRGSLTRVQTAEPLVAVITNYCVVHKYDLSLFLILSHTFRLLADSAEPECECSESL